MYVMHFRHQNFQEIICDILKVKYCLYFLTVLSVNEAFFIINFGVDIAPFYVSSMKGLPVCFVIIIYNSSCKIYVITDIVYSGCE